MLNPIHPSSKVRVGYDPVYIASKRNNFFEFSSISSLNPLKIVPSVIFRFVHFLKSLLCCSFTKKEQIPSSDSPEIDPLTLSRKDPFCQRVFIFDSKGYHFREKKGWEGTKTLLQILGAGGPWDWYQNFSEMIHLEKEIGACKIHPLVFLYFLFLNQSQTARIVHFKDNSSDSTILRMVLALTRKKDPWEEFVQKQVHIFDKVNKDYLPLIPGFCKALALQEKELRPLVLQKNWRELIHCVLEKRKAHFLK